MGSEPEISLSLDRVRSDSVEVMWQIPTPIKNSLFPKSCLLDVLDPTNARNIPFCSDPSGRKVLRALNRRHTIDKITKRFYNFEGYL